MSSPPPRQSGTYKSQRAVPRYTTMSDMPPYHITSVGCTDPIEYDRPESFPCDDLFLLDSVEIEDLYIGLAKLNQERSNSTSSHTLHDTSSPDNILSTVMTKRSETLIDSESNSPVPEVLLSIPGERRRAQNRVAQRAHRERQKRYIAELESKFIALQANFTELDKKCQLLQRDNEFLISLMDSQQIPTVFSSLPRCTEPFFAYSSGDLEVGNRLSLCGQDFVWAPKLEGKSQAQPPET